MREVSGSTWTFQMIIFFILIFACFLTLVLSYSKAYTIKNRMLTIIEKYEGVTSESSKIINDFIYHHSYKTTSTCPSEWMGAIDLEGNYEMSNGNNKYYYCYRENTAPSGMIYYDIEVFYRFNLPVIGEIATYRVEGQTNTFIGADHRYN